MRCAELRCLVGAACRKIDQDCTTRGSLVWRGTGHRVYMSRDLLLCGKKSTAQCALHHGSKRTKGGKVHARRALSLLWRNAKSCKRPVFLRPKMADRSRATPKGRSGLSGFCPVKVRSPDSTGFFECYCCQARPPLEACPPFGGAASSLTAQRCHKVRKR